MDIKKLIALDVIVSTGSFNKAAEELGYTQAGISSMMNSLENELGIRLLDRKFNGIQLNENGKILLPEIKNIIESYEKLNVSIDKIKHINKASIRIASLDTVTIKWLPKTLSAFHQDHPDIEVKILSDSPTEISKMLEENLVDMAITDRTWTPKDFSFTHLYDDLFYAVFPKDADVPEPFPVTAFKGMRFIMPDYNTNKDIPRLFKSHNVTVECTDNYISNQSVLANIEAGHGVSIFTPLSLDEHFKNLLKIVPLSPKTSREICAVVKSNENINPTVKLFIKYLKNTIKQLENC